MTRRRFAQHAFELMAILLLVACGRSTADVPSLNATPTSVIEAEPLDDEAKVMAFAECLREQGIAILDPVVDADGNVGKPELPEGIKVSKDQWITVMERCGELLEGVTWAEERVDRSNEFDYWYGIAVCFDEKGYDVGEPTAESIDLWLEDLKSQLDWDDPDVVHAWEDCNENTSNQTGKK